MLTRSLRRLALAVTLFGPALVVSGTAEASYFAELSIEDRVDASTYIVEGEVVEVWTELAEGGRVWTRARLKVTSQLKGPTLPREVVLDSLGGTHGDYTLKVVGAASFSPGEEVVAFLHETSSGRLVPVSKFLGKFTVRRANGETRKHAMNWQASQGSKFDHRFLPHPPATDRLYLEDLRARITARVAQSWEGRDIPGISRSELERINAAEFRRPE
jgi:hypothetical protein